MPVTNHCCPQNRTQNINSRRLNNFLGAMCLDFRRTGIYHIKVFYSPYKQSSLCFLCSSFFLLISIVRVLHHCNTLQSAGGERMTDCLLLKSKVCASLQPAAASLLGKVLSVFSSLTFFFFFLFPPQLVETKLSSMSHKTLDFNREHKTLLLCAGQIPKTNLVLSSKLQATLHLKGRVKGEGKVLLTIH